MDERALATIADVVALKFINKDSLKAELGTREMKDVKEAEKELEVLALKVVRTKERDALAVCISTSDGQKRFVAWRLTHGGRILSGPWTLIWWQRTIAS